MAPRESATGKIKGGCLTCLLLRVVDPVEDPESLELARDREVLERALEGSAVEGLYAPPVLRSPEPVEGAKEDALRYVKNGALSSRGFEWEPIKRKRISQGRLYSGVLWMRRR